MQLSVHSCLTAQAQTEGTEESQTNPSVPQQEEQADATEAEVRADYELNIYYEETGPKNEQDAQKEKEENYDAKYENGGTSFQDTLSEEDTLQCLAENPACT